MSRLTWIVLIVILALCAVRTGGAQQAPTAPQKPATGVIVGTVVDAVTNAPIGNATVNVSADGNRTRTSVIGDDEGRFVFSDAPAGRLMITSSKTGYMNGYYGIRSPYSANQFFDLEAGERATGVIIRMWKNATISGTVTDGRGEPVVGASVMAMRLSIVGGGALLSAGPRASTDDRGMYQLPNLSPSAYAVVMPSPANMTPTSRDFSASGFPTMFYPDTTASENATILTLGGGEERNGIDFHVTTLPTFSVTGAVSGRTPGLTRPAQLSLRPARSARVSTTVDIRRTTADAQGRFTFPGVLPGPYVLEGTDISTEAGPAGTARPLYSQRGSGFVISGSSTLSGGAAPIAPLPSLPALWGSLPITVDDRNVEGLSLALLPGARINGRVVFEGPSDKPDTATLLSTPVMTMSADGRELGMLPASGIKADGSFETVGLPAGVYEVMIFMNGPRWTLTSMTVAGQEQIGMPLTLGSDNLTDIVFTYGDRPTELTGLVTDDTGKPSMDATIYVFASDRRRWTNSAPIGGTAREVRPGRTGTYKVPLVPGEYLAVAVEATAQEGWRRPDVLENLARAAKTVKISAGQTITLNLAVPKGK